MEVADAIDYRIIGIAQNANLIIKNAQYSIMKNVQTEQDVYRLVIPHYMSGLYWGLSNHEEM